MAKLDIDFILIDESVAMYGFRALMSGADLAGFIANPVLLIQHNRPTEYAGKDDIMLPAGKWYDIRVEGDKLLAKPEFDDDDKLAMKVQNKVLKGYMNGASVWIEPTVVSDDPGDMLPGQYLPTFTKWGLLEASIVDIPNCRNSLAIRTAAGKKIKLGADVNEPDLKEYLNTITKHKTQNMEVVKKLVCEKLGLDENSSDTVIGEKLSAVLGAQTENTKLAAENIRLSTALVNFQKEAGEKKVTDLVDAAVDAKKLAAGDRDRYVKLATADFETTKEVLDAMVPYESIETKLGATGHTATDKLELDGLVKLSGHELYMGGKLERLRALDEEQFKLKYKEALGIEYKA